MREGGGGREGGGSGKGGKKEEAGPSLRTFFRKRVWTNSRLLSSPCPEIRARIYVKIVDKLCIYYWTCPVKIQ